MEETFVSEEAQEYLGENSLIRQELVVQGNTEKIKNYVENKSGRVVREGAWGLLVVNLRGRNVDDLAGKPYVETIEHSDEELTTGI